MSRAGVRQEQGRSWSQGGVEKEQRKEQESSKVEVVHIPNFIQILLRHRSKKDLLLVGFDRSVQ